MGESKLSQGIYRNSWFSFPKRTSSIKTSLNIQLPDCSDRPVVLRFTNIYRGPSNDEKFDGLSEYLKTFLEGGVACVFNHGVTRSGKSYTMFGNDGILVKSVEVVLESNKKFEISAIEILRNKCFDVVSGQHRAITDTAQKETVCSIAQFKKTQEMIMKARTQKETNQNQTSSRSHLLIKLSLCSKPKAEMAFIDLAGWENPEGKEDIEETRFINKTLSELNAELIHVSNNEVATFSSTPLLKEMKPYFRGMSKTLMLYHISVEGAKKGLENIKDVVANFKGEQRAAFQELANKTA